MSHEEKNNNNLDKSTNTEQDVTPYCAHSKRFRWFIVFIVAMAGVFSPICTSIYFPALSAVADDLNVTVDVVNLSVSIFMVLQGISPTFWASISDVLGRRPVYLSTFLVFIGACYGLANTHSYSVLMVLRCVQACGSASVMALGASSIGDIADRAERGGFMGIFNLGPMLGPCIGPVIGGLLAHRWGWHSIFWLLGVWANVVFIFMLFFLPETLRSLVGNGSIPATGINSSLTSKLTQYRLRKQEGLDLAENGSRNNSVQPQPTSAERKAWKDIDWLGSIKIFANKDAGLILVYNSMSYTSFMCSMTSLSSKFESRYDLSQIELGLCYFAAGFGSLSGSFSNGFRLNYDYRVTKKKYDGDNNNNNNNNIIKFPINRARLRSILFPMIAQIGSLLAYGWCVERHTHLSAPLVFQFLIGFSATMTFNTVSTLLIDLFPKSSASAVASNNLSRCLLGAAGTAAVSPLINAIGFGFAFTIIAGILLLTSPAIWVEWKYGQQFLQQREQRNSSNSVV